MKWFKHDTDANMDAKLQEVMLDYGLEGYGLYWYCIELIAQRVNGDNLTFELEHDCRIIARNTGSTPQKVEQMMKSFINLGLLDVDSGHVFCLKLASRCDDFTAKAVRRNGIKALSKQSVGVSPSLSDKVPLEEEEEVRKRSKKKEDIKEIVVSTPKFNFKSELLALGVDKEVLQDWLDVRKKKKAANTKTAFTGLMTEIKKSGLSAADAIKISAENSWAGFKASWYINIKDVQNKNVDILALSSASDWHLEKDEGF